VKTLHKRLVGAPILGAELVCVLSARRGPAFEHREGVPLCASDGVRQLVPLGIRPFFQGRFATRPVASGREPLFVHAAPFKARTPWLETGASVRQSKVPNVPNGANGCASSSDLAAHPAESHLNPPQSRLTGWLLLQTGGLLDGELLALQGRPDPLDRALPVSGAETGGQRPRSIVQVDHVLNPHCGKQPCSSGGVTPNPN
jgi:hypothetical protein